MVAVGNLMAANDSGTVEHENNSWRRALHASVRVGPRKKNSRGRNPPFKNGEMSDPAPGRPSAQIACTKAAAWSESFVAVTIPSQVACIASCPWFWSEWSVHSVSDLRHIRIYLASGWSLSLSPLPSFIFSTNTCWNLAHVCACFNSQS